MLRKRETEKVGREHQSGAGRSQFKREKQEMGQNKDLRKVSERIIPISWKSVLGRGNRMCSCTDVRMSPLHLCVCIDLFLSLSHLFHLLELSKLS